MRTNPFWRSDKRAEAAGADPLPAAGPERRSAPRHRAEGEVRLRNFGALACSFSGRLIDVGSGGFCASHQCLSLTPGQLVAFEMGNHSGMARAVWTRIVDGNAQTGFRIIPLDND